MPTEPTASASPDAVAVDWRAVVTKVDAGIAVFRASPEDGDPSEAVQFYANPEWFRIAGLEPNDALPLREALSPFGQSCRSRLSRAGQNGLRDAFTARSALTNIACDIKVYPIDASHFGVLFVDVTNRREREQVLLREREDLLARLSATVSSTTRMWEITPDLLSVCDMQGRWQSLNPAWIETLGWDLDNAIGTRFSDYVHPDDLARSEHTLEDLQQDQPAIRFQNRLRHEDGTYRTLSWVSVRDGNYIYSTARDITQDFLAAAD